MYIKEIQTYGFKSFADKMNFEFTKNINGIVGPNGSGKSNVVDAVRWVLGEQSNRQLRAVDTTSVIFSGSKSRKPLNSAMVNIIFDNTDRCLPIDFNEVSIKRVLYRTGENEYYLNNEKCRLKDISELLIDSGAAKESFNIIGQGKIDEILTTKAVDRRIIFEEAAGVLKYKKRKEEAIRKLERTNNNINRVNDIINELETNLEPLENQSSIAKKYLDDKEKLTNYDISLMIYDVENYSNELNVAKSKIDELNDKITELNSNSTTYDVSILQGKDKLNKLENTLTNNNSQILELTKEMEKTDADIRLLRERKKYIENNDNSDKISFIKENILVNENKIKNLDAELEIFNKKVEENKIKSDELNKKYNDIKNQVFKYNNLINDITLQVTDINYQIRYLEESINSGGNLPNSVKSLINNPLFSGVIGTLSSLIETDNEYSLAVSTSMGAAANYLVVDDKNSASRMVEYLKSNKLGRATFLPLDVIKARYMDEVSFNKIQDMSGFINRLDRVLKYDSKYQNVILNQFGAVILADNIENANKISSAIGNRYKIVTLDGQVVNVGGSITGGDKIKSNDIIRQKYELEENKIKLNNLLNNKEDYLSITSGFSNSLKEFEDKISSYKIEENELNEAIKNKKNSKDEIGNTISNLNKELNDILSISKNLGDSEEDNLLDKYYKIKNEIDNLNKENSLIKLDRDRISHDIEEIEQTSKNSNLNISKLEKELKNNELKTSKLEVKIDNILNSLNEDYTITYSEAKNKYILEDNPEVVREEVISLKNRIRDYGIVNLGAIEEYDRVSSRYEFLRTQREDLNKAEETLLEIINDMDNIMKERFIKTFDEIRIEFRRVFRELFRGGEADIYMTDPENILETGIELEATPPGKKLKNIQALSGGEKTFTAISLLFAILNVRPVPFCLFDEVEAALDEANVDAFGEYLNKYRDKTQFIIITHKKKTMEFIDTLYGITMQESGVSKKVSVKLGEIKDAK